MFRRNRQPEPEEAQAPTPLQRELANWQQRMSMCERSFASVQAEHERLIGEKRLLDRLMLAESAEALGDEQQG